MDLNLCYLYPEISRNTQYFFCLDVHIPKRGALISVFISDEQHHGGVRGVHRCTSEPGRRGQREESEGVGRAAETAAGKGSRAGEIPTGSQKTAGRGVVLIVSVIHQHA